MGNNELVIDLEDLETTPLLRRVIVLPSGGPFLEGYVLSIIGMALGVMGLDLIPNTHQNGLLGISVLVGLFLGASFGGQFTDLIGRRKMSVIDLVITAILSILYALVHTPLTLMIPCFFVGAVVDADYPIATPMIAESSPRKYHAAAIGIIATVWYLGANVAAPMGFVLINTNHGWRYILTSSAVPCILILVGRQNIPESPRRLISKGQSEEAQRIVHETLGANVRLPEAEGAAKASVSKVLQGVCLQRVIFVGIIWLCQVIPMFVLCTYGPQVITIIGLGEGYNVLLGELLIGTFFTLGTLPAMYLYEKAGCRPPTVACFGGTTVTLAITGFLSDVGIDLIMGCFISYVLLSGGPGNLEWLYLNELFPTKIRATAMGFAMAFSRTGTTVSIYVPSGFISDHGIGKTTLVGALISALGLGASVIWAPETCGYTLAETESVDFKGR